MSRPQAPAGANHRGPTPESTEWPATRRGVEASRVAIEVSSALANLNNACSIEYLSSRTDHAETALAACISSVERLVVEIGQIHVTVRHDVHSENISPFVEANLEKLRGQIPVVPLTPG